MSITPSRKPSIREIYSLVKNKAAFGRINAKDRFIPKMPQRPKACVANDFQDLFLYLKHEIQHYESIIKRDSVDYEFSAKAKEVAKFEDDMAQHLKKEKSFLFVCESVLSALMDDLREVEARIHMLEEECEEWQGEADAFLSKASNLRLQLLHTNEKKKLKIQEFNTAKKKKQELHNDLGRLSKTMIQNYEWIEGEKDRFGVSRGELDFKSINFHAAKKEYEKLLANKAA
nr:hypothetical protein [Tanacetum cinerariifolium]